VLALPVLAVVPHIVTAAERHRARRRKLLTSLASVLSRSRPWPLRSGRSISGNWCWRIATHVRSLLRLSERPFDITPNPRFLYLTPRHREALSNLKYGLASQKSLTLLLGEAGTGKTTLVRAALQAMQGQNLRYVYLNNPTLTRAEFYEFLATGLGLGPEAAQSKTRFLFDLQRQASERSRAGGITLWSWTSPEPSDILLEEIRLLANIETTTVKLLPLVLSATGAGGTPE